MLRPFEAPRFKRPSIVSPLADLYRAPRPCRRDTFYTNDSGEATNLCKPLLKEVRILCGLLQEQVDRFKLMKNQWINWIHVQRHQPHGRLSPVSHLNVLRETETRALQWLIRRKMQICLTDFCTCVTEPNTNYLTGICFYMVPDNEKLERTSLLLVWKTNVNAQYHQQQLSHKHACVNEQKRSRTAYNQFSVSCTATVITRNDQRKPVQFSVH